jgi:uncharacterized phage-associated protein
MTNSRSAINIAEWFFDAGAISREKTYENGIKLQNLLCFAQLIHLAKCGRFMFDDEMIVTKQGPMAESVQLAYENNFFAKEAKNDI